MKKMLMTLLCGLSAFSFAANDMPAPQSMMPPACQQAWDHMKASREKIKGLIAKKDAKAIGDIIIADDSYMKSFMSAHPECRRVKHGGMMPPLPAVASGSVAGK